MCEYVWEIVYLCILEHICRYVHTYVPISSVIQGLFTMSNANRYENMSGICITWNVYQKLVHRSLTIKIKLMAAFMFPHTHVNKNNGSDLVVAIIINININGI